MILSCTSRGHQSVRGDRVWEYPAGNSRIFSFWGAMPIPLWQLWCSPPNLGADSVFPPRKGSANHAGGGAKVVSSNPATIPTHFAIISYWGNFCQTRWKISKGAQIFHLLGGFSFHDAHLPSSHCATICCNAGIHLSIPNIYLTFRTAPVHFATCALYDAFQGWRFLHFSKIPIEEVALHRLALHFSGIFSPPWIFPRIHGFCDTL